MKNKAEVIPTFKNTGKTVQELVTESARKVKEENGTLPNQKADGVMVRNKIVERFKTIRETCKTDKERLKYCMTLEKAKHSENTILSCYYDVFHGIQLSFLESCIKIPFASIKEKTPEGEDTHFVFPSFTKLRSLLRRMPELEKLIKERREQGQSTEEFVIEKNSKPKKEEVPDKDPKKED
jgi:hypothetical protein